MNLFGFPYPNFTSTAGAMTPAQFVLRFAACLHNPNTWRDFAKAGTDLRKLNPDGVYLKHLNLRTIVKGTTDPSHPDYNWIHANHPEWIIRDANGNTVPLFVSNEECLDFANDAYLDYALNEWMPKTYLDPTDSDPAKLSFYLQDNGHFLAQNIACAGGDPACKRYTTDAGMQSAWKHMLDRFKARWPNKKILVNTGTLSYMTPIQQLPWMQDVLSHSDGYHGEILTNDHSYWNGQPNNQKRNALEATLLLADWLAANGKYFYPNLGMGDGKQPTQKETDYGFAFFNLVRRGNLQFYSQVVKDSAGFYQPRVYPEMNLALGEPLGDRQQVSPGVYRRSFQYATACVNISDATVSMTLPSGTRTNSLGLPVDSPLSLASFSGLTVYHGGPTTPIPVKLKGRFEGTIDGTFTPE